MANKTKVVAPRPAADAVAPAPVAVVAAFRAIHAGEAAPHQQQMAFQWLIREACGKAYFPYHASDRDTVFALGRQFVGDLVIGMCNAELSTRVNHEASPATT